MESSMRVLVLVIVGLMLTVGYASAIPYGFYNVTGNNVINAASGESELSMVVTEVGTNASFMFYNSGVSSITDIYFEDPAPSLLSYVGFQNSVGVQFTVGANPSNLPGGESYQFTATHSYDSESGQGGGSSGNGVSQGEWLQILFNVANGSTFDEIIAALDESALRVGLHVQSFAIADGSEGFINVPNNPVPEPGTVVLLGAGFLGLAIYGKRRRNS